MPRLAICIEAWGDGRLVGGIEALTAPLGAHAPVAWAAQAARAFAPEARIAVVTEREHEGAVRHALAELWYVAVVGADPPRPSGDARLRRGRKWALAAWRGGLGGGFIFDEEGRPSVWKAVVDAAGADELLVLSGAAPLISAGWLAELYAAFRAPEYEHPLLVAQAPPGQHAAFYRRLLVEQQAQVNRRAVEGLRLNVHEAQGEPEVGGIFHAAPPGALTARLRLMTDTRRGRALCRATLDALGTARPWERSVGEIIGVAARIAPALGRLPRELILEATTRCNQRCTYCPQPAMQRVDGDFDPALLDHLAPWFAAEDDVVVTIGGWGEPLLHPALDALIAGLKAAGALGVHVETNGVLLDEARFARLAARGADVVSVSLDADTAPTYRALRGEDRWAALDRTLAALAGPAAAADAPWLVCELVKLHENLGEMEAFFRRRWAQFGAATVKAYHPFEGQGARGKGQGEEVGRGALHAPWGARAPSLAPLPHAALAPPAEPPDRNPLRLHQPRREPCWRLAEQRFVSASGDVFLCGADFEGRRRAGRLGERPIGELIAGPAFAGLLGEHAAGRYPDLCAHCTAWDSL